MKKIRYLSVALCVLLLMLTCVACGGGADEPGVTYTEGLRFEALDADTCALVGRGDATATDLIVPAVSPEGKRVVGVAANAFENEADLTSVRLPATVVTVGARAFAGCTGLTSFSFPDKLTEVGAYAFSGCSGIRQLYLGSALREVGDGAFYGCTALAYAFFRGDATAFGGVRVGSGNSAMTSVLYLYSDRRPTDTGRYWYYSGGQFKLW